MSAHEEKLAQASRRSTAGPARCTLAQLHARWGKLGVFRRGSWANVLQPGMTHAGAAKVLLVDDVVQKEAMGGTERWRVTSIADGDLYLRRTDTDRSCAKY